MKTRKIIMMAVMIFAATSLFAQNKKTEEIKVYGNWGMCATRIEKAAGEVPGVVKADWSKETKMLKLTYKTKEAELADVHKAVAKVGHDTDVEKADDKAYNALPGCCKYDRPEHKKSKDK